MSKIMKPNIIFILLDGARWDRLSVSPDFMKLTKEGTLLNNVTTAIPYTIGSINVTFSGMYGKENGIDAYYKMFKLKNSGLSYGKISDYLKRNRHRTKSGGKWTRGNVYSVLKTFLNNEKITPILV